MNEKPKSSITNIFVYLIMIFLLLIVIMPPIFRVVFKEEEVINTPKETATALTCKKVVNVGSMVYNVTLVSNYSNDILKKVTFTYLIPQAVDNTVTQNPVMDEINYLRNTHLVEETISPSNIKFILTKENKEANPTNNTLDHFYNNDVDSQEKYITSLGYTCSRLTA